MSAILNNNTLQLTSVNRYFSYESILKRLVDTFALKNVCKRCEIIKYHNKYFPEIAEAQRTVRKGMAVNLKLGMKKPPLFMFFNVMVLRL